MATHETRVFTGVIWAVAGFGAGVFAACGTNEPSQPIAELVAGSFAPAGAAPADSLASAGTPGVAGNGASGVRRGVIYAGSWAVIPGEGSAVAGTGASVGAAGSANTGVAGTASPPAAGSGELVAVAGAGGVAGAPVLPPPAGSCLEGITNFDSAGPFQVESTSKGSVKLFVPKVPAGCKVPVTHLANGTGGTCAAYAQVHQRLASHGFLATCYESGQTGAGAQGVTAIEAAFTQYPDLADKRIGSTGHSQGGQAAFVVLQLAEAKWGPEYVYAGLAMQPASGFGDQPSGGSWQSVYAKIKSPMFMFSGTRDTLVSESWVKSGFDALSDGIEAYNWSAVGATHVPTPQAATMQVAVAWFRWKLLGDKAACQYFKALPAGEDWDERNEQNELPCE